MFQFLKSTAMNPILLLHAVNQDKKFAHKIMCRFMVTGWMAAKRPIAMPVALVLIKK